MVFCVLVRIFCSIRAGGRLRDSLPLPTFSHYINCIFLTGMTFLCMVGIDLSKDTAG